ncbi:retron system putative HNH endonuclease [Anabaena lutea]|uniref:TIGR02646 family protein n=1 Tax=Anabaena lutea FACHB-196 TaxID=2692881 RepID=A0ABR8F9E2_9NOST|nr:retron system putative HNH endonuclease [Anabaena lutea]MBD2566832.1 TIGR02646 family protein [Anabaena lutea FACHB-196]
MKYIEKGKEPEIFTIWKAQKNDDWEPYWNTKYTNFQAPEKPVVHDALLKEQGYICCYCGIRIFKETSHIEHLQSRSKYPDLALEYTNFMASCQGEDEDEPTVPVHCGHQKKEWYDENLMVSPLEPNCADFFKYPASGEILPTDDLDKKDAAETTIKNLALDIDKLRNLRKAAIEAALFDLENLSEEEVQRLALGYELPDSTGKYTPFCSAIIYILKSYF